ncbi:copper transporter [Iodidimonas nitroreducens]|uniref:Copper transporter n=2 Tax=Iodidimonas nitroreducens TaxID=1236968 RepID=A0A5A7N5A9_9PROT|nr:type I secretion outer membrane protein, TolC family [alpha proteobacterium Q-1]GER03493.1 copper transporter [Iodidimonas nitroreducens]
MQSIRLPFYLPGLLSALFAFSAPQALAQTQPLHLDEAVMTALQIDDPSVVLHREQAKALDDQSVAQSQLPDPQISVRMQNLPTSFDPDQEAMTQYQTMVRQSFPAGRTLALRHDQKQAEARGANLAASLRQLEIIRDTRLAWLEIFYWTRARERILKSRDAVTDLLQSSAASYGSGSGSSQSVWRTDLELSLLDDRLIEAERKLDMAKADLARAIGATEASRPVPPNLPPLKHPEMIDALEAGLINHPVILAADSQIEAQDHAVDLARQHYKPDWSVEAGYGVRGGNRDDFISAGITLDIPLFTAKRQDRSLSAARHERQAARLSREARLLDLKQLLQRSHAAWQRLAERKALYQKAVIIKAEQTAQASALAYQNGLADFPELIRARLAELDAQLTLDRLSIDHLQAQAHLLFFEGRLP